MKRILHNILVATIFMATSFTQAQGKLITSSTPAEYQFDTEVTFHFDLSEADLLESGTDLYLWAWTPSEPDAGNGGQSSEFAKLNYVNDSNKQYTMTMKMTEYFNMTAQQIADSPDHGYIWLKVKTKDGSWWSDQANLSGGVLVLGTKSNAVNNSIAIYPNPATDYITVDFGNVANLQGNQIKVINILGQEVFSQNVNTREYTIPVNNLSRNSLYFVKVQGEKGNVLNTKKIVVK